MGGISEELYTASFDDILTAYKQLEYFKESEMDVLSREAKRHLDLLCKQHEKKYHEKIDMKLLRAAMLKSRISYKEAMDIVYRISHMKYKLTKKEYAFLEVVSTMPEDEKLGCRSSDKLRDLLQKATKHAQTSKKREPSSRD